MRMKHDHALRAPRKSSEDVRETSMWKRSSSPPERSARMASTAVTASAQMLPTTTDSSGPTKVATAYAGSTKETPEASAMGRTPRKRSAKVGRSAPERDGRDDPPAT